MSTETAQFLQAASSYESPKERRWMWCECIGTRTDFVRIDETRWRCPDCGRVVEVRTG